MRYSSKKAAEALAYAGSLVKPGVSGDEVDRKVHEYILGMNCYPSPLGYSGFPKSICVSINEIVCHGIPDDTSFQDGDIVSIDVSLYTPLHTHGDNCGTFMCGNVDDEGKKLVRVSKECLEAGIQVCREGAPINAIGAAIEEVISPHGYGSVKEFSGHGIGQIFHRAPWIHHYRNNANYPPMKSGEDRSLLLLFELFIFKSNHATPTYPILTSNVRTQTGMTFTIEPMITEGSPDIGIWSEDDWTVATLDYSRASQFEHTVLITKDGCEILTQI
jgi:methionyl aminopeptidase